MAGLTSMEGEAIEKSLDLDTLTDLVNKIQSLEGSINLEVVKTKSRANEAARILNPGKTVDGEEIRVAGRLYYNIVKDLDEAGLRSALTHVKRVRDALKAKQTAMIAEQKARWAKRNMNNKFEPQLHYVRHLTMSS